MRRRNWSKDELLKQLTQQENDKTFNKITEYFIQLQKAMKHLNKAMTILGESLDDHNLVKLKEISEIISKNGSLMEYYSTRIGSLSSYFSKMEDDLNDDA